MKRISSRRISPGAFATGAGLLAFALIVAALRLLAPTTFLAATAPLLSGGDRVAAAFSGFSAGFSNTRKLAAQNAALAAEASALAAENQALSAQIADLTALIGSVPQVPSGVAAGVIARPPESAYDTLIVGAGADDGIVAGDAAFAAGGTPLGAVAAVSGGYARVALLSASGMRTFAWLGPERLPITLVGQGGGAFTAEAPRSATTTPGEAVYVAGPGSLPIGTLAKAGGDPSAPFTTLYIEGRVNPGAVTMVLIRPGAPAWSSVAATSPAPSASAGQGP
jgi:hypothetical protein